MDVGDELSDKTTSEKEELIWKSRELKLRTKVLQSQLVIAKQAKHANLGIHQSTNESIVSIDDEKHERLKSNQKQMLESKHDELNQLNHKIRLVKSQIFLRCREMIQELWDIYPIIEFPDRKGYSICEIHLPNAENLEGHDETMVSIAIGYVGHLLLSLSEILDIALRFPLKYFGSRSIIYCSRKNQSFPLFVDSYKSREWLNFTYGVKLLNLDIVQIRTLYGLPTNDPDETLANLHSLRLMLNADGI